MIRHVIAAGFAFALSGALKAEPLARIAAGREVYVAEGCINCHSQYVRPATADAARWGPQRPLADALEQAPPLLGNRRQGPDLQNVANRRPRSWQRLHLIAPRSITPGSRMPAYAPLFAGDGARGEALLDYLDSLGGETMAARWAAAQQWAPQGGADGGAAAGRVSYLAWCAGCHGQDARGTGPLAAQLPVPPRDLVAGTRHYLPARAARAEEHLALARLIKFGLPGSAMAGHEYLTDTEIATLADYVQGLRRDQPPAPTRLAQAETNLP